MVGTNPTPPAEAVVFAAADDGNAWGNETSWQNESESDGFPNYVPTSIDPGYWIFVFVAVYSALLLIGLPIAVALSKRWEQRETAGTTESLNMTPEKNVAKTHSNGVFDDEEAGLGDGATIDSTHCPSPDRRTSLAMSSFATRSEESRAPIIKDDRNATSSGSTIIIDRHQVDFCRSISFDSSFDVPTTEADQTQTHASRAGSIATGGWANTADQMAVLGTSGTTYATEDDVLHHADGGVHVHVGASASIKDIDTTAMPSFSESSDADESQEADRCANGKEENTTAVISGSWAPWKPKTSAVNKFLSFAKPDKEAKRILRLALPFTLPTVGEALFDAATVAVLSHFLGTNAVTAYVLVDLFLGLTDEFIGGFIQAEGTICAHAYGAGNNFLAGQYVQISMLLYIANSIPFLLMWAYAMGDALRALGVNEDVQAIGVEYTKVAIFSYLIDGITSGFGTLLDITGHEYFGLLFDLIHNLIHFSAVVCLVMLVPDAQLVHVATIEVALQAVFLVGLLAWSIFKGWYSDFWGGMLRSFAICNRHAVKNVVFTAIPLSIGSFLEYGEWELLTFFSAFLGPAEVATWALLGSIWELLEASTEGLAEAAAVRVAFHLGKGHPALAKLSSYKSMLLSFVLSLFVTTIFFICGNYLPIWLSSDKTIQHMLSEIIPLVGFGNITMAVGMVSWELVGAQGRHRLATFASAICSWFVTIPLSAAFVLALNINLKGLVGAVIVGNITSGFILMCIILRSDWKGLSEKIQELNAMTGEISIRPTTKMITHPNLRKVRHQTTIVAWTKA